MGLSKGLAAGGISRIQNAPVGKDHPCVQEHTVAVVAHTAAHPGGVICHNTADHAAADARRIRSEMPSEPCQVAVDVGPHDARLKRHAFRGGVVRHALPALAGNQQQAVGHRLPRQGRPRRAEGDGHSEFGCRLQHACHFLFASCTDDRSGSEPVETSVRPPGKTPQGVSVDPFAGHDSPQPLQKFLLNHNQLLSIFLLIFRAQERTLSRMAFSSDRRSVGKYTPTAPTMWPCLNRGAANPTIPFES